MVSPSPLQIFSAKSSAASASLVKFKALLQTLILSLARSISRAKSRALQILKHANHYESAAMALKRNKNNILFGSFRLHYNWCSSNNNSHVMPAPDDFAAADHGPQLAGYLQWLEEETKEDQLGDRHRRRRNCDDEVNEIDKLAEIFIANCHEKFRLEKQESYRRFQDMIARSL